MSVDYSLIYLLVRTMNAKFRRTLSLMMRLLMKIKSRQLKSSLSELKSRQRSILSFKILDKIPKRKSLMKKHDNSHFQKKMLKMNARSLSLTNSKNKRQVKMLSLYRLGQVILHSPQNQMQRPSKNKIIIKKIINIMKQDL